MLPKDEVKNILKLTDNNFLKAIEILEKQLNTLHVRAQVLMSLAGIVITVTGFSGRAIAGTSLLAQALIIFGLVTVLSSAVWIFIYVMKVRWLTNEVISDNLNSLEVVILQRNKKTKAYSMGGRILCIGLFLYSIAFSIMLLNQ